MQTNWSVLGIVSVLLLGFCDPISAYVPSNVELPLLQGEPTEKTMVAVFTPSRQGLPGRRVGAGSR